MVVDSIADLCNPDKLLHEVLPSTDREDDTPHDIREWVAAHS
jgi:NagD protein